MPLRILTGGESHGPNLSGIIEGLPAGLRLDEDELNQQLSKRQQGYGRGGRMKIESDRVSISSGLRFGTTLGSPLVLQIDNRDWTNWTERMGIWKGNETDPMTVPRPGHADLAGIIKYGHDDIRNILERASARETAMRTAIGAVCRQLLKVFDIEIIGLVAAIGSVCAKKNLRQYLDETDASALMHRLAETATGSPVRCADRETEKQMMGLIDLCRKDGDSIGGLIEVAATGVPAGLGSHVHWDRRLDARLAALMMSIPGIKSVEIGMGTASAALPGSEMHDAILSTDTLYPRRASNHAGGIEGGMSNGQPICIRCAMKAIPTLTSPLPSIDIATGKKADAHKERSDVCAVPAASVVGEAMLAIGLAEAMCERHGHDNIEQMRAAWKHFSEIRG
ncbi:chorismate synthase [bacterium]|nr:chorismate synthase [bacterium]